MADTSLGKAYVQIIPSAEGIGDGIAQALGGSTQQATNAIGQSLTSAGKTITGAGKAMSVGITAPFLAATGLSSAKFAEVDKTMQLTNATMGNSQEQAELLNRAMEQAAAASVFGMSDAANASLNFARAGLDAEQAAAALAPAMNLAAGEGGDLDTVSAGLVATINGFHGSFDQAGSYADVFANACNNSALDVNSLSGAMSIAAPIFSSAGYAVNDAALYMGVLANAGVDANVGANSLKTGMARLVSPAKQGAEMMEKLGISITNSDGSMKDSVTVQKELHDAFSTLSESEQIAAASAIFGKNQMAPWLALINTAPEDVSNLSTKLGEQGTTSQMAASMMSGYGGSIEQLKSALDVLATRMGSIIAEFVLPLVQKITDLVTWFTNLDDGTKKIILTIGAVLAIVGPLLMGIGSVITMVGQVMIFLPIITALISPMVIAIGAVIAIVIAVAIAIAANWGKIKEWTANMVANVKQKWADFKSKVSETAGNIKSAVVGKFQELKQGAVNKFNELKQSASEKWTALKNKVSETVSNLKSTAEQKIGDLKTNVSQKFSDLKEAASEKWSSIKETVGGVVENLKESAGEKLQSMKDKASDIFEALRGDSETKMGSTQTIVTDAFDAMLKAIGFTWGLPDIGTDPLDAAKEAVDDLVDGIEDMFDGIDLSLPDIELPHLSVSWEDLGPISIPHVSVDWYARGGIVDGASIIGVGEAGPEAVIPLSGNRMRPFASAIAEELGAGGSNNQEVIELLREYLPAIAQMKVMLDSGALVGQIAPAMDARMGVISARKGRGN